MVVFTLLLFCGWMVVLFPVHYSNPVGIDGVITNIEGEIITLSVKVTRSMLYKDDAKAKV
jgi:uncharacterized integral membrane protein